MATSAPTAAEATEFLDQGWSEDTRQLFYFTPQGSRLIPLPWLLALETPAGGGSFTDRAYLKDFGWIYHGGDDATLNPGGLPIGFATDPAPQPEGEWTGLTCAACHTSEVQAGDTLIRIDGGPARLDFDVFYAALTASVRATALSPDPSRFERFADLVLGSTPQPGAKEALRGALAVFEAKLSGGAALRHSTIAPGFGRVDALNQITNALAVGDLGVPTNLRLADAPVSYPHLWLTPKLDWVQWNPVAASPLGRNAGEVLGVFGAADLRPGPDLFNSTVLLPELIALEDWIGDLKSPPWPAELLGEPIDAERAAAGRDLFARDCAGCHNMPPFRMTDAATNDAGRTFIRIGRIPAKVMGTDPVYLESFLTRTTLTGGLAEPLFSGVPIVPGAEFFTMVVGAVSRRAMTDAGLSQEEMLAANGFRSPAPNPASSPCERLDCLKAGPLLGTWATGPFLHNGSVPTIYELLSPPEERRSVFWTGDIRLDPDHLGFVSDEAPGLFRYDTRERGNSNMGHVFPAGGYTIEERLAVIEYLKNPNAFAPEPHF